MSPASRSSSSEPRLVRVSRRHRLLRSGAVAGALLSLPGLACASTDAEVFADAAGTTVSPTTSTVSPTTSASSTSRPSTTAAEATTTTVTEATTTTLGTVDLATIPAGAELLVSFTYEPSSSGQVHNPYVAVWIEDADGNLVDTISLWFSQSGKGTRWLSDLRSWYSASNRADDTTMSGATRVAGAYTVAWDGTDLSGAPVEQGEYTLYIEAAREHGPYEITSTPITIGTDPVTVAFADDGEIVDASAQFVV